MIRQCDNHTLPHYYDTSVTDKCNHCYCVHGTAYDRTCLPCNRFSNATQEVAHKMNEPDMVHQPPHYTASEIECIDAMRSAFGDEAVKTYCLVAAFKYLWRQDKKAGEQDIRKAVWYLRFASNDDPRKDNA